MTREINRPIKNLPIEDLKKLLRKETKAFIDGLENGIGVPELKALRASMKEISEALEERIKNRMRSNES
jgi:hypothetical protein